MFCQIFSKICYYFLKERLFIYKWIEIAKFHTIDIEPNPIYQTIKFIQLLACKMVNSCSFLTKQVGKRKSGINLAEPLASRCLPTLAIPHADVSIKGSNHKKKWGFDPLPDTRSHLRTQICLISLGTMFPLVVLLPQYPSLILCPKLMKPLPKIPIFFF